MFSCRVPGHVCVHLMDDFVDALFRAGEWLSHPSPLGNEPNPVLERKTSHKAVRNEQTAIYTPHTYPTC